MSTVVFFIQETRRGRFHNNDSHVVVISCADTNVGDDMERVVFGWYQLLVLFLLPVLIILYCYMQVIRVLWISTLEHAELTNSDGYGRLNSRRWFIWAPVGLTDDALRCVVHPSGAP